jgi:effector-binding domain-containing protein
MKKMLLMSLALAACAVLALGQEAKIQDVTPFTYACLECTGPYDQMAVKIPQFIGEFFKQKLVPAGTMVGVYLNSPAQVKPDELKWRIGFIVAQNAGGAAPLTKAEFSYTKAASIIHTGPYEKVGETFDKLMKFVASSGFAVAGPLLEKYLNNPQMVKPEELKTEVIVPVEPIKK